MVFAWEAFQIGVGEHQRCINQAVDHQAVVFFAQLNRTRMVTLKRTALRRDCAIQRVDRREVDGADGICRQPFNIAAHDVIFELDRHAVWRFIDTFAKTLRPRLHFGDQRIGRCGLRTTCRQRARTCRRRTAQKRTAGWAIFCFII